MTNFYINQWRVSNLRDMIVYSYSPCLKQFLFLSSETNRTNDKEISIELNFEYSIQ